MRAACLIFRGQMRRTSTNSVIWGTSFGKKCYVQGLGWWGKECLWTRSAVKLWSSSSFPQTSVPSVWADWKKSAFCKESFILFWLNWWFQSRYNFTHMPSWLSGSPPFPSTPLLQFMLVQFYHLPLISLSLCFTPDPSLSPAHWLIGPSEGPSVLFSSDNLYLSSSGNLTQIILSIKLESVIQQMMRGLLFGSAAGRIRDGFISAAHH